MAIVIQFFAALLASTVEMVEALTIILAVGVTRSWRPALLGMAAGFGLLAIVVAAADRRYWTPASHTPRNCWMNWYRRD